MARENIIFKCSVCGEENYIGTRNKRKHTEKMEIQKEYFVDTVKKALPGVPEEDIT